MEYLHSPYILETVMTDSQPSSPKENPQATATPDPAQAPSEQAEATTPDPLACQIPSDTEPGPFLKSVENSTDPSEESRTAARQITSMMGLPVQIARQSRSLLAAIAVLLTAILVVVTLPQNSVSAAEQEVPKARTLPSPEDKLVIVAVEPTDLGQEQRNISLFVHEELDPDQRYVFDLLSNQQMVDHLEALKEGSKTTHLRREAKTEPRSTRVREGETYYRHILRNPKLTIYGR